ncbi:hypothetical protein GCM10009616_38860 [Microlunatus lacustris]
MTAAPPDAAVPGLDALEDTDRLAALLAERGETLRGCRYRRWKPGTSTVLALELASGPAWGYAVSAGARPKLDKTIERAPVGSVLLDRRDLGLLVARPSADRDLAALADLDRALSRALRGPALGRRWCGLAYKPQRRWVGALDEAGGARRTVRVYRRRDLPAARAALALAADLGGVRAPREAAAAARGGLLVTSWLPGRPLDRLLDGPTAGDLLDGAGAVLARVHAAPVRPDRDARPEDAELTAVRDQLVALLPGEAGRVRRLAGRLADAPELSAPRVLRHGDFSVDQVVVDDDGRPGLVDWDRAHLGRAVDDLATADAAGLTPAQHQALLTGYATVRPLPAGLPAALARARFLRAAEPFRRCSSRWPAEVRARLDAVEEVLA